MKGLALWLWNGEDVGKRMSLALIAIGAVFMATSFNVPADPTGWVRLIASCVVVGLTAGASKPKNGGN